MSKVITLLGSTGSIGTQSLDVCRMHGYEVFGLSANSSVDKLLAQIAEFHPKYVAVTDPAAFDKLSAALAGQADAPKLLKGAEGLRTLACMDGAGTVLNAVVGIAGLDASLAAIESGHDLALANKESLVTGGHLVTDAVKKHGVHLLRGQRAQRYFPVLAGSAQRQNAGEDPADGLRRPVFRHDHRAAAHQDEGRRAQAPELEYGRQNHD